MRITYAALVAAFFISCATPDSTETPPQCSTLVADYAARQLAAGHVWRGAAEVAPGTTMGVFSAAKAGENYFLLLAAPGALVPPPESTDFKFVGFCKADDDKFRVYEGTMTISGDTAARSE